MSPRHYPVELDLRGWPVLMVGGGRVAARKLPELLACGAEVTLVAPELDPAAKRLIPGLRWEARAFDPGDLSGKRLAFACADDPAVNEAVGSACRAAGIPCNRADAADRGDFIVPGVLRRGNVTVSISTGGRVPSLTRHLKRKLSGALGGEWSALAEMLAELRGQTRAADSHAPGQEPPFDAAAEALRAGNAELARRLLESGGPLAPEIGTVHPVWIAGAGPGGPDLLTLGTAEALRQAEVLIHDRLVDAAILAMASDHCLRVPAEKRGHFESRRQEHINAELVHYAKAGKKVMRLKGGDPFVFGRGFEEALALEAAGIPWRILPGVTSATAVPALAGIPLTHRGLARSFAVASGMAGAGVNPVFPKADTLVLLMALYRLEEIVPALYRAGYAPATPAAAIQGGGLPEQRVCRTTLEKLAQETARLGFDSPALIVVGEVAALGGKK